MSRVYTNVVIKTIFLVIAVGSLYLGLNKAGAGPVILPLTAGATVGLLNVAQVFGRRARGGGRRASSFNPNSTIAFVGAWLILGEGVAIGLAPFMEYQTQAILSLSESIGQGANAAVIQTILLLVAPVIAASVTVITTYATRDEDSEDEDDVAAAAAVVAEKDLEVVSA